jgi:quercetin dioxygenase-like cupin family protein
MKTTHLFSETLVKLSPGYNARLFPGENVMLSLVTAEANADSPEHSHPHEQLVVVLKGEFEMVIGGEHITLKAGDTVAIPGNVPHSAYALTECELLDVFTPVRDDLLARLHTQS